MTGSDDGMEWLDGAVSEGPGTNAEGEAVEGVGRLAKLTLYNVVRATFNEKASKEGLTRTNLAERLGVARTQISRLLGRPSNMTIDTAAKLMFAMGEELTIARREDRRLPNLAWTRAATPWEASRPINLVPSLVIHGAEHWANAGESLSGFATYFDGSPGLRTMTVLSGCTADGVWEQIEDHSAFGGDARYVRAPEQIAGSVAPQPRLVSRAGSREKLDA